MGGSVGARSSPDVRERGAIGYEGLMAVFVALGAFLMTLAGGWTAQRVTDRRHLVLGLAGGLMLGVVGLDLLPEALKAAGEEVFGVPAALLLFVAGFLWPIWWNGCWPPGRSRTAPRSTTDARRRWA